VSAVAPPLSVSPNEEPTSFWKFTSVSVPEPTVFCALVSEIFTVTPAVA
jgi:hypothetical protein